MSTMKVSQFLTVMCNGRLGGFALKKFSTSAESIDIPKRIPRSSTDILKAIANTYQRDPTAAHYKYHDDPYLIPYSNSMKRSYALSQESGRKAAQWVRQQHADLFQHKVADPMIEAYIPKLVFDESSEVDEATLHKLINSALVSDSITVYNLLKKKGEVSLSTKQCLFEFLCYFNSEDPISEDWIEERWFKSATTQADRNTWKQKGLVAELFDELKDKCPASYSSLICGMCQHGEISKAFEVYDEARSKAIPLNLEVYSFLLSRAHLARESHEMIWNLVKDMLLEMNHLNIRPNIGTLNGVLETLSKMNTNRRATSLAFQTLSEFKSLGIEPSLATYVHLLEVFYRAKPQLGGVMSEILRQLQGRTLTIQDPKDILFFVRAMETASLLKNKDLAYRLHSILLQGDNYNFIGDSFKESVYYRNFFFILANMESLPKLMELYDDLVPSIYVPEPAVTNAILKAVQDNMAFELLPRLWSDIVLFEQAGVSGVLENILSAAASCSQPELYPAMSKIAWEVWYRMENNRRERTLLQWTGTMLGNVVLSHLKANEVGKAHLAMDKLVRLGSTIMNEPPVAALRAYLDCCIQDESIDMAIKTIEYCDDIGFTETSEFAQKLSNSLKLSDRQRERLAGIVGADCLKPKSVVTPTEKKK